MNSAKPSSQNPHFDPATIKPFSVIYVPYTFAGKGYAEWKYFVVLCHQAETAVCIKTTTQIQYYTGNNSKLVGCVYLKVGTVTGFNQDTIVEPDNPFPIPHATIIAAAANPKFTIFALPEDFRERLCHAISASETLKWTPKKRLMGILGMK